MSFLSAHMVAFLEIQNLFQNTAAWILSQASWVILAALVVLGLQAWMNGRLMALFGGIVVAGILYVFTINGGNKEFLDSLSKAIQGIFTSGK